MAFSLRTGRRLLAAALLIATNQNPLAAQEFEQNLIRWDYGPEGGVLEEGVAETAEETAAEEEARV